VAVVEEPAAPAAEDKPSPLKKITGTVGAARVTMQYSSPGVKGRTVWGDLVPYGSVWRTGANEATWLETDQALTINGKELPAGKYAVFTIPQETGNWTLIFNTVWDQWGAFDYDQSKDALRVEVVPAQAAQFAERMDFTLEGGKMSFSWENKAFTADIAAK
jgi:hypothetical protein